MAGVVDLREWIEQKERRTLSDVTIGKFSDKRIGFAFSKCRDGMSLDRENFEKLVQNTRRIMGWNHNQDE